MSRYIKSAVKEIKHSEANCSFKAYSRQLKLNKKNGPFLNLVEHARGQHRMKNEKKMARKRDSDAKNSM